MAETLAKETCVLCRIGSGEYGLPTSRTAMFSTQYSPARTHCVNGTQGPRSKTEMGHRRLLRRGLAAETLSWSLPLSETKSPNYCGERLVTAA